ncbi:MULTISPECIES: hypothetical protein [Paenibacillus]|uniref:hypothetical protein n=1 Tax=Paenibacillus TaxID=44249 RepID=UPI0015C306A1|nr:hypothetical protein [Paenibacillus borealis]
MNNIITILSVAAIAVIMFLMNKYVKNKSRMRLVLAIMFVLYISTFIIIGMLKDS